jgi:hypothetical protein
VISPKIKYFLKFKFAGNLIPFLVNSNLEKFCHLWQFRILNLIFVINYCDCWAAIHLDSSNYLTMTLV